MSRIEELIKSRKKELLSPEPLRELADLEKIIDPKPNYLGPGAWIKLCTELSREGEDKAEKQKNQKKERS
ncbi:MAG TPA: hypothetical protein ENN41_05315 [Sediminispirochaeta sp.]|nr:hypothetical protein [Sediminispirochaeta sp.]